VCVCDVRENNFVWKWGSAGEYFFPQIFKKKIINLSNIRDKRIEWGNQKIKKSEYRGGRSKGDWDRRYFFFLTTVTIEDVEGGDEGYTNIFLFLSKR
jgi:hypothetical protein